jgi:hypothetical protein
VSEHDIIVHLKREQDNKVDPNAVKVIVGVTWSSKTYHIGYINKNLARILATFMDSGFVVVVESVSLYGGGNYNCGMVLRYKIQ